MKTATLLPLLAGLVWLSVLAPACGQAPAGKLSPWPPFKLRPLEKIVVDLTAAGRREAADRLRRILGELGYPEKLLAGLVRRQDRTRPVRRNPERRIPGIARRLASLTSKLAQPLGEGFASVEDAAQRRRVAVALLEIDADLAPAHRALGHVQVRGRWVAATEQAFAARKAEVHAVLQRVRKLSPEVEVVASGHELLNHVHGRDGHRVSFRGLEIHTCWPAEKARRLVRNLVRAIVFSKWLIRGGELELPDGFRHRSVLFTGKPSYLAAITHDREKGRISPSRSKGAENLAAYYRRDRTLVNNRTMENHALAGIFCHVTGVVNGRLHDRRPHPTLTVGHANWVLMSLAGAHLPGIAFTKQVGASRGTATQHQPDEMQLLFGAGLMGARAWLRHKVRAGEDPAWSRSFRAQVGMIDGVDLLKTTFVAEYLHLQGTLDPIFTRSQKGVGGSTEAVIRAIEKGVGRSLREFESGWRSWMKGLEGASSLLAELGGAAVQDPMSEAVLGYLARVRTAAHAKAALYRTPPPVSLSEELSAGCEAHARYLEQHRDQAAKWPDAHEQFTDREGFTPEGCWAGNHSVIAPGVKRPVQALDGWMGTFYHRLPLIDPGLLQVGWGFVGTTAVMDSGSVVRNIREEWEVVWPPDGAARVPTRFQPELPHPFPDRGLSQSDWGFPVTVQLGPRNESMTPELKLTLRRGSADGAVVPSLVSSPQNPGNPLLVPRLAWCLIPTAHLEQNTRYFVELRMAAPVERTRVWSFTTGR